MKSIINAISMSAVAAKNINEYNQLIHSLNPHGKFQYTLYLVNFLLWGLAGLLKTLFDLRFNEFECPYARATFQCLGILLAGYIASHYDRKVSLVVMSVISMVGVYLCFVGIVTPHFQVLVTLGIALCGVSIYSQPYLSLCIICELAKHSLIKYLFCISLATFSCFKIMGVYLINLIDGLKFTEPPSLQLVMFLLAPISLTQLGLSLMMKESPRAMLEIDFEQAKLLLKNIININGLSEENVLNKIDDNFVLKRIMIRRHYYSSIFHSNEFGLAHYSILMMMLLLGIISECPHYVLQRSGILQSEEVQVLWISSFQLIGLLSIVFFIKFSLRKLACIANSVIVAILNLVLFLFFRDRLGEDLEILALNAVFSVSLYAFLFFNAVEMYPHSVRTVGIGLVLSLYYLGAFLIRIYLYLEPTNAQMLELFMEGSVLLVLHTWGLRETLGKGLRFELDGDEKQENDQF